MRSGAAAEQQALAADGRAVSTSISAEGTSSAAMRERGTDETRVGPAGVDSGAD